MQQNQIIYLSMGMFYPVFVFLAFAISGMAGGVPPFSMDILIRPFTNEHALLSSVLVGLLFLDMCWYHLMLFPQALPSPKNHLILFAVPEVFPVFGLVISVFDMNPWAILPFALAGLANYAYAYVKVSAALQKA